MLLSPSPTLLINYEHQNFTFNTYYSNYRNTNDMSGSAENLFTDICFFFISSLNKRSNNSYIKALIKMDELYLLKNNEKDKCIIDLIYGIFSLSFNDSETAIFWLKKAASAGDTKAMILLGRIYCDEFKNFSGDNKSNSFDMSRRWFLRALRCGSMDASFFLGVLYYELEKYDHSLVYFNRFYQTTKSPTVAMAIGLCLEKIGEIELSRKWVRISFSKGVLDALERVFQSLESQQMKLEWLKKIDSNIDLLYFSSNVPISIARGCDESIKIPGVDEVTGENVDKSSIQCNDDECKIVYTMEKSVNVGLKNIYPAKSPTELLLKCFELASPIYDKRNLSLCNMVLQRLIILKQGKVCDSAIFRDKCRSKNPNDLISCALIVYLMGDSSYAIELLKKASIKSTDEANMLLGVLIYCGLGVKADKRAAAYFSRSNNPVAIAFTGMILEDSAYIDRASCLFGLKNSKYELARYIGDEFFYGIHIPRSEKISLVWYNYANKFLEESNKS